MRCHLLAYNDHACKIYCSAFKSTSTTVTIRTSQKSPIMPTATATLDHELQVNGRLTIDSFCKLAGALAERRSAVNDLPARLRSWRDNGHDAAELQGNILLTLDSLRRSLAQWSVRFDGNYEHLQRTLENLKTDAPIRHAEDTILAHTLVDWCKNFPAIVERI